MNSITYCFLDTNVLLHFQTFDEVDWPSVIDTEQVCLIFTPAVMAEVNKFKDDHTNEWRQKRARTLLAKLRTLFGTAKPGTAVPLREHITVLDIANEPKTDWASRGLDPQTNDDRIIA